MKKIFPFVFLIILLLCSCEKSEKTYDVTKNLFDMKSYSTQAIIDIYGNKGISKYKVKQYFSEPDRLRIETLEPDILKGKTIIKNNDMWKIYHPSINQTLQISKLKDNDELIYMGLIRKDIFSGENSEISNTIIDGEKYITITAAIPGGNAYRYSTVIYISEKSGLPKYLQILDKNGDKRVNVEYFDFKYNEDIKESLFELN